MFITICKWLHYLLILFFSLRLIKLCVFSKCTIRIILFHSVNVGFCLDSVFVVSKLGILFNNVPDFLGLSQTSQSLTTDGSTALTLDITSQTTEVNALGGAGTCSLADGAEGQTKIIIRLCIRCRKNSSRKRNNTRWDVSLQNFSWGH